MRLVVELGSGGGAPMGWDWEVNGSGQGRLLVNGESEDWEVPDSSWVTRVLRASSFVVSS